jgi:HD-GYP domain-containing protein (c-di-GMP phosphodiesterase class II)
LDDVVAIAASAHERLDGTGYHRGTSALALDRAARILAAADVASALAQDRPHRPAYTRAEASWA